MPSGITARPARRPWSTCFAASPWCSSGRWATKAPTGGIGSPWWSDLLLGTRLRALSESGDTTLQADEIRKGGVVVETSGEPVLTPQAAKLGYYLELYAQHADTMTVTVRVMDTAGAVVVTAARVAVPVGSGGGTTEGTLDLSGLPPGR